MNRLALILVLGTLGCATRVPVPVPNIKHSDLPSATMGQPYQAQLVGGKLKNGSIPSGMTISSSGMLSGTPAEVGTYTFTVSQ